MATLAATRFNEQMSSYLQALRRRGRVLQSRDRRVHAKLLCILNAMLRDGRPYDPQLKPKRSLTGNICFLSDFAPFSPVPTAGKLDGLVSTESESIATQSRIG